jgi:hypothetical protein
MQSLVLCRTFSRENYCDCEGIGWRRPAPDGRPVILASAHTLFVRQKQHLTCGVVAGTIRPSYLPCYRLYSKSLIVLLCSPRNPHTILNIVPNPPIRHQTLRFRLIGHLSHCEYLPLRRVLSFLPLYDDLNWSLVVCTLISAFISVGQLVLDYNGI